MLHATFGLFVCLLLAAGSQALIFPTRQQVVQFPSKSSGDFKGQDWALLIAGSGGWGNYRHQADVCHAYQVLRRGGLDDDHIVVMMADDLAQNFQNPHPGQLFNRPGGENVYDGVPTDYTGSNVNAETFLAVLLGDSEGAKFLGTSGKVIASGPEDRVFVYFADHGAPGILGMPFGPFLYADQLLKTLHEKAARKGFADMVLYVEACESGSIFEGMLEDSLNIYVTTAANAHESSWGTYCPGMQPPPPQEMNTCLGDLYSVAFLENCDETNLEKETLESQYKQVKLRTSNNNTFLQGSHVMQYGALIIDEEPAADYLGDKDAARKGVNSAMPLMTQGSVPQRDADLLHLWTVYLQALPGAAKAEALRSFNAEVAKRTEMDAAVRDLVNQLLANDTVLALVQGTYKNSNLLLPSRSANMPELPMSIIEHFVTGELPRPVGAALVDDWDCLRGMMETFSASGSCAPLMDQYGMQYSRTFANLCNAGVTVPMMQQALAPVCGMPDIVSHHMPITIA